MRASVTALAFLLLATVACSAEEDTLVACATEADCSLGELCLAEFCRSPDSDFDKDGLSNAVEQALGTSPSEVDSDGDGKRDGDEVGDADAPTDSDGDGDIDALESAIEDPDHDGLPNEIDVDELVPDYPKTRVDAEQHATLRCESPTVCAVLSCEPGWLDGNDYAGDGCEYECTPTELDPGLPAVAGEVCNQKDDDCDGETDEGLADWCRCSEGEPVAELCNQVDDDCDGQVDEVADLGACRCSGGVAPLEEELCNRVDDDCDGLVDENVPRCACQNGKPGQEEEVCNGVDDDCDEQIDDVAAPETCACSAGVAAGEVAETCNGVDDDCDELIDEAGELDEADSGCAVEGVCEAVLVVRCEGVAGWVCDNSALGPSYEEVETRCDQLDNDCDGLTDEALAACACSDGADALPLELCNGVDDDCNGLVDDGPVGETCACSGGLVVPGSQEERCNRVDDNCDGQIDEFLQATCACAGGAAAKVETCNGVDDDCNDAVDDGLEGPSYICPSQGVCEGLSFTACLGTAGWGCDTDSVPNYENVGGHEQSCDGLDNDCDGHIDEYLEGCACSNGGQPSAEICNGIDDDCNGAIDDGMGLEDSDCRRLGVCDGAEGVIALCQGVQAWACYYQDVPGYEAGVETSCDDLDNDCDGETDEDLSDCACTDGGEPGEEICNHVDDDCDGLIDQDLSDCQCVNGAAPLDHETCNRVDDDCNGVVDDGLLGTCQCEDGAAPLTMELCNSVDDDCNEQVDEGLNIGSDCLLDSGFDCILPGKMACAEETGVPFCSLEGTNPKPNLLAVAPTQGTLAGGTRLTVSGEYFLCAMEIYVDGEPCTDPDYVDTSEASCTTPPGAGPGPVDVRVRNPDSQEDTLGSGFTYIP